MDKTINQRITYYRKMRGLSQIQVAKMLGMKSSTYSQCERQGNINCELLIKLSHILDVSCNSLLFGTEKEPETMPFRPTPQQYTAQEQSLIKVMQGLSPKKRSATYKTIELIWKNKIDPSKILSEYYEKGAVKKHNPQKSP